MIAMKVTVTQWTCAKKEVFIFTIIRHRYQYLRHPSNLKSVIWCVSTALAQILLSQEISVESDQCRSGFRDMAKNLK